MTYVCWVLTLSNAYTLTLAMCDGHKLKKGSPCIASGLVLCGDLLILFMCSNSPSAIIIHVNIIGGQFTYAHFAILSHSINSK